MSEAWEDLVEYLQSKIASTYAERAFTINRLFDLERNANETGDTRGWERIRNQRSAAIWQLEADTEPMKQQIIAIWEAANALAPARALVGREGE